MTRTPTSGRRRFTLKGAAIALGAFLGLAGLTFAAVILARTTIDGSQTRVNAGATVQTATCNDPAGTNDPTLSGPISFNIGTCAVTNSGVTLTDTYEGYAPTVSYTVLRAAGTSQNLRVENVRLEPVDGEWATDAPVEVRRGNNLCSALISTNPVTLRVQVADTGTGTPEPFRIVIEYGPQNVASPTPSPACEAITPAA